MFIVAGHSESQYQQISLDNAPYLQSRLETLNNKVLRYNKNIVVHFIEDQDQQQAQANDIALV